MIHNLKKIFLPKLLFDFVGVLELSVFLAIGTWKAEKGETFCTDIIHITLEQPGNIIKVHSKCKMQPKN